MHCGARPYSFSFVFDFARSPTDFKPQTHYPAGAACRCVSRDAPAWFTTRPLCRSCMLLVRCHARAHGYSVSPLSLRSLASSVVLSQHVTACTTLGCPVALARPQTPTKLLLAQPRIIASLRPIRPQLLDGLQALAFSAQLIIILLISGIFSAIPAPLQTFGLSTGNNTLSFFLSLFGYRVSFRLASSLGAQPLYGLLNLATGL